MRPKNLIACLSIMFFSQNGMSAEQPTKQLKNDSDGASVHRTSPNYEARFWSNGSWMARPKFGGLSRQDGETMAIYCVDGVKMLISNESRQSYAVALPAPNGTAQPCSLERFTDGEISIKDLPAWVRRHFKNH